MGEQETQNKETMPFYPDHLQTELKVVAGLFILTVLVGVLGLLFPVGLGEPADSMNTPAHVKPEWYFLALYQILKFVPKTVGSILPVFLVALFLFWPFIDRREDRTPGAWQVRLGIVIILVIVTIGLTIWGEVS